LRELGQDFIVDADASLMLILGEEEGEEKRYILSQKAFPGCPEVSCTACIVHVNF
jgi:hypothetical protein